MSGKFAQEIYSNRENITVQWVLCPKEKCRELEIKLQDQAGGTQNPPGVIEDSYSLCLK